MNSVEQNASGITVLTQAIAVPMSLVLAHGAGEMARAPGFLLELDPRGQAALLVTGVLAATLGMAYALSYKAASAASVGMAGNFNKAVTIVISIYLFGDSLSRAQRARSPGPPCVVRRLRDLCSPALSLSRSSLSRSRETRAAGGGRR